MRIYKTEDGLMVNNEREIRYYIFLQLELGKVMRVGSSFVYWDMSVCGEFGTGLIVCEKGRILFIVAR